MRNYGYACINMGFSNRPKAKRITTNRTMIKRTFHEKGYRVCIRACFAKRARSLQDSTMESGERYLFLSPVIGYDSVG